MNLIERITNEINEKKLAAAATVARKKIEEEELRRKALELKKSLPVQLEKDLQKAKEFYDMSDFPRLLEELRKLLNGQLTKEPQGRIIDGNDVDRLPSIGHALYSVSFGWDYVSSEIISEDRRPNSNYTEEKIHRWKNVGYKQFELDFWADGKLSLIGSPEIQGAIPGWKGNELTYNYEEWGIDRSKQEDLLAIVYYSPNKKIKMVDLGTTTEKIEPYRGY